MENSLTFKSEESGARVTFDPNGGVLITLESDMTQLTVTVQSPTKTDSQKWVGGIKKK